MYKCQVVEKCHYKGWDIDNVVLITTTDSTIHNKRKMAGPPKEIESLGYLEVGARLTTYFKDLEIHYTNRDPSIRGKDNPTNEQSITSF